MSHNTIILLRALLQSGSGLNTLKYSKDKKRRGGIIGGYIGMGILGLLLVGYCLLNAIGYGMMGLPEIIPTICALLISVICLIFTLLKSNGYLFGFKEFDMLVAMPLSVKDIVSSRFLYMYVKSFPWIGCTSLAMMIGYGVFAKPAIYVYLYWLVSTVLIPVIPMVVASLLGALIAGIGSRFKFKNIVQTVLLFAVILLSFVIQFAARTIQGMDQITDTLETVAEAVAGVEKYYLPLKWFDDAIVRGSFVGFLLLTVVSVLVFVLFYSVLVKSYIKVNSRLSTFQKNKKVSAYSYKKKSVANTIALKEWKRMLGSATYMTNACFGHVFVVIASVVVLFVNADKVVSVVTQGAPIQADILLPTIPFVVYFFLGMVSTCCCTPSLEGKNYWIMQSLPLTKRQLVTGKMLFNIYLNIPVAILGVVCFGVCFRADISYMLVYLVTILALLAFSTAFGMVCGLKFMKLEWENEIEVIKQGAAVAIYMFPNMIVTMLLLVGSVFLSFVIDGRLVLLIIAAIYGILAWVCYRRVTKE